MSDFLALPPARLSGPITVLLWLEAPDWSAGALLEPELPADAEGFPGGTEPDLDLTRS